MPARSLPRLLIAGLLATLVAITSGALVGASASAAACAGWPLCLDALGTARGPAIWIALGHRLLVLLALLLALAGAAAAWRAPAARAVRWLSLLAAGLLATQSLLGALLVLGAPAQLADVWHLAGALLALGAQTLAVGALLLPAAHAERLPARAAQAQRRLRGLAWWSAAAAGVAALAVGARGLPAPDLQLATGLPANAAGALAFAGALAGLTLGQTRRTLGLAGGRAPGMAHGPALLGIAAAPLALALLALVGLLTSVGGHLLSLSAAALLWASALGAAIALQRVPLGGPAQRPSVARAPSAAPAWRAVVADYVSLTKPKVISLLLVTTLATMYLTEAGPPSLWLIVWTLLGGYLAAGGAGAINCALDSDIDINMGRTSRRPVPSGRISPRAAMIFGLTLSALAALVLWAFTTPLAALCATLGVVYYAYFYTRLLKRSTWQNIIIGGGAGAIPPLVGWTAVTGSLSLAAVVLFAIIFYWTPPHFWALALVKQKDYARAGVPMLPVVAGEAETRWQILVYSAIMLAVSLLPVAIGSLGWVYLAGALLLGALFMRDAWAVWRVGDQAAIWRLYKYSLLYLALLFAAMVADRLTLA